MMAFPPGQAGNQLQLALSDPPDGIGIADVSQAGGSDSQPKNKRSVALGILPAIPFETVQR
jgi:hypothetical protein